MTLRQLRNQFGALKRKYARVIAMAHARPAADQIVELWNIALAKGQPRPENREAIANTARESPCATSATTSPPSSPMSSQSGPQALRRTSSRWVGPKEERGRLTAPSPLSVQWN